MGRAAGAHLRRDRNDAARARAAIVLLIDMEMKAAANSVSPLPWGEVGAQRRVRGYSLTIDRNPSPQPSPKGRGSAPPLPRQGSPRPCQCQPDAAADHEAAGDA